MAYRLLEQYLGPFPSISILRLALVKSNDEFLNFWEKVGFQLTGEVKPYSNKQINSEALIMEKDLD